MAHVIDFTVDDMGSLLNWGRACIGDAGNFWHATVLTDVPLSARVFNDKPFGPMAAVRSFNTPDEAIAEANRLPHGCPARAS